MYAFKLRHSGGAVGPLLKRTAASFFPCSRGAALALAVPCMWRRWCSPILSLCSSSLVPTATTIAAVAALSLLVALQLCAILAQQRPLAERRPPPPPTPLLLPLLAALFVVVLAAGRASRAGYAAAGAEQHQRAAASAAERRVVFVPGRGAAQAAPHRGAPHSRQRQASVCAHRPRTRAQTGTHARAQTTRETHGGEAATAIGRLVAFGSTGTVSHAIAAAAAHNIIVVGGGGGGRGRCPLYLLGTTFIIMIANLYFM
eukprot:COSAG01_NODE_656_length_14462_cov_20.440716_3_plen_258_part_00